MIRKIQNNCAIATDYLAPLPCNNNGREELDSRKKIKNVYCLIAHIITHNAYYVCL